MSPTFFPTYKKIEKRNFYNILHPDWFDQTYRVWYKEPIYKMGRVKKRVSGFTDRILYYYAPYYQGIIEPEKIDVSFFQQFP